MSVILLLLKVIRTFAFAAKRREKCEPTHTTSALATSDVDADETSVDEAGVFTPLDATIASTLEVRRATQFASTRAPLVPVAPCIPTTGIRARHVIARSRVAIGENHRKKATSVDGCRIESAGLRDGRTRKGSSRDLYGGVLSPDKSPPPFVRRWNVPSERREHKSAV